MSFRNLLVTGGAGFIGSCFVGQAVERGGNVIVLDALTYAGHKANLEWIPPLTSPPPAGGTEVGNWRLVVGNIADRKLVSKLLHDHAIEAVVHFAAESHVDNSIAGPKPFIDTNVSGTFQLLEACREYWGGNQDFRFINISTDEVYGSLGTTGKFSEASPIKPNSPYSASKAAGDHLARAWHETYGLPVITTHCTNNYGPRQHPEKLIPNMIRHALAGQKLPVYGDGKNVRDWIHVEDHCDGLWLALEKGKPGQVYDFGGDAETENIELVRMICALLDKKCPKSSLPRRGRVGWGQTCSDGASNAPLLTSPLQGEESYADQIAFVTDRPGHDRRYAIDDAKSQRELGFTRRYKLEQGLEATVEWYLSNQAWCDTVMRKK